MAGRAVTLGQEPRVLVTRVAVRHLRRHVIGGRAFGDVRWNDGFHEVGVLRLGHWFKSYSHVHRRPTGSSTSAVVTDQRSDSALRSGSEHLTGVGVRFMHEAPLTC